MSRSARSLRRLCAIVLPLVILPAWAATRVDGAPLPTRRGQPHAGYAYPGGGRVGTTFKVNVGGQYLRTTQGILVSGEGVRASVVFWLRPAPNLDGKQRRELQRRLRELRGKKLATTPGDRRRANRRKPPAKGGKPAAKDGKPEEEVELPESPLLEDMESMTLEELKEVERYFFTRRIPLQRKRAIEETVKIQVTIDPDAEPGIRDLRLVTKQGLTNPIRFRVGVLPEVKEREPNYPTVPLGSALDLPVVMNGQILPRDVDVFRITAKKGQRLVIRAEARGLVPYQADSVPGWMQATLTLRDARGREVAFADEYRFDPDPVLYYEVPEDGTYLVEVRDAVARGRDDFVYRVTAGELPFVTQIFPLGGQTGTLTRARVEGWNLNWRQVPLDTRGTGSGLRETAWRQGQGVTNEVTYAVDTLPEDLEAEPNDTPEQAPVVTLPRIVNGTIGRPGDLDLVAFEGRRGQVIVAEITARSLGSPLDSLLRLVAEDGEVVAWNDDFVHEGLGVRGLGLQTHHADSYLRAKLPKSGTFYVRVADVRRHGGEDHAYRLRVGTPRPEVQLFVSPSSINLLPGRTALLAVRAVRKDGFDGGIDVKLRDIPDGFFLSGARIPAGRDRVIMTLTAPRTGVQDPITPRLVGLVEHGRETVELPVLPADDMMQAFLWRHIVPTRELVVLVYGRRNKWIPIVSLAEKKPVALSKGRRKKVRFDVDGSVQLKNLRFELVLAPKGLSVGEAKAVDDGFTLEIKAGRDAERTGNVDNLIVEVFLEQVIQPKDQKKRKRPRRKQQTRRSSRGYLPAIPYVVRR